MSQRTGIEDVTITMEQQVQFGEVSGVGIVSEVINDSGYQKKLISTADIIWQTLLELEPGKKNITSEEYVTDQGTEHESVWRVELDPNHLDPNGVRHLSVYLNLVETHSQDGIINALYTVCLMDTLSCTDFSENEDNIYKKSTGITQFSKDSPAHGFDKFIPYHRLGPYTRLDKPEKLKLIVALHIIKDDSEPEEPKETTPIPTTCVQSDVPLFYNHGAPLNIDANLQFERELIPIDSERLSYYTSFFEDYYIKEVNGRLPCVEDALHPDLEGQFETKILLLKIIEFCHKGKLATMPKRWNGLCKMLKRVKELGIVQLKSELQIEIMKRMNPERFTEVVELAMENIFDCQVAFTLLYDYLRKNIDKLAKEESYKRTFEEYKSFYAAMLLYSEKEER